MPHSAEGLLRELGVSEPSDIMLEGIALHCGATVAYEVLQGAEARLVGNGPSAVISVSRHSSRPRQRFSIAHELGHWARHRGRVSVACGRDAMSSWSKMNPETQANQYAADLLMPDFMFRPRAHDLPTTFESVAELAEMFQTSMTATAIRLVQKGWHPSMVVSSKDGRMLWFRRSPDLSERLWPSKVPGLETLARKISSGERVGGEAVDVPASEWFDDDAAAGHWLVESAISVRDGTVISLLWWEDESHLAALDGASE